MKHSFEFVGYACTLQKRFINITGHLAKNILMLSVKLPYLFQEKQNDLGCKGPLKVIWSNHPAQSGPARVGCPGTSRDRF